MLLLAVFESEVGGWLLWLHFNALPGSAAVVHSATLMGLVCGLPLSKSCVGPWWCQQTVLEVVYGTPLLSISRSMCSSGPLDDK